MFDPMKICHFSTDGVTGVWIASVCVLWFCMRCLRSDKSEFMVLVIVSMVLTCGV
jgi:hypothetical protein